MPMTFQKVLKLFPRTSWAILLAGCAALLYIPGMRAQGWELVKSSREGIEVFTRTVDGSEYKAFKSPLPLKPV